MKSGLYLKFGFGLVLCLLSLVAVSQQTSPATNSIPAPLTVETDTNAPVDAPVTPVPSEKPVPSKVKLSIPASELVRLANSGVEQSVLLAYVTNSTSTFNLGAEEIIYLNDIGVASPVVTAMLQHDQALNGATAATIAANTPPPQTAQPMPEPPPVPNQEPPQGQPEAVPPPVEAPLTPPETTSDFYGALAPYGSWVNVDGYGPCWQPTVVVANPLWQPYCDGGHWIYTDCGWYWSSGYSWGWAPFHYGRWFRHHHLGWCWAPDTVWGPSWVAWRHSDAYCGWAPLPPGCNFTIGIGLTFHGRPVHGGDDCGLAYHHYNFVAWRDFHDHHLSGHRLPREQAVHAFNHSVVANRFTTRNNVVVNQGVPAAQVASATHAPLHPVALQATSAPSAPGSRMDHLDPNRHTLTVYRPTIREPARPAATIAQNTRTGTTATPSLERAPWRPVSAPSQPQSIAGRTPTGAQVHSGAHLAPSGLNTVPTVQNGVRTPQLPSANSGAHLAPGSTIAQQPVTRPPAQQNPTIINLKGPQSPSTAAARPAWNPYTQNPTPWQTTPAPQRGFNSAPQTAMNVPQAPVQTQRPVPTYSGQNNQAYRAPAYQAPNFQAPNYQTPTRSAQVEVPRYNSYPQSRAYSPPAGNGAYQGQSAPAYQAPPAQRYSAPAPSAPPARSSPPPQQPSRDSGGGGGGNGRGR